MKSKCCGVEIIPHPQEYVCSNCDLSCIPIMSKPTELEEKKRGKKHPLLKHYKKEPSAMEKIADDIDAEQEEERKLIEEIHGRK